MATFFALLLFGVVSAQSSMAQSGIADPEFAKVPFDQWLTEIDQLHFHWAARNSHAELSFHQRLISSIDVRLDGRDLESRRSDGKLLVFLQITDSQGLRFQEHGEIILDKLDADVKNAYLDYSQQAFFVPGDYRVAVAIQDSNTLQHAVKQWQVHIGEPLHFWLADTWIGLPSVEFLTNDVSPESWYLPNIRGRLPWAESIHSASQLNVVLNVSASAHGSGDSLSAFLPFLKLIAFPGSPAVHERVALVDLSRRKTVFEQNDKPELDWPRLKKSLERASTASIDVHSLSGRQDNAQFFLSEVRRVLRASTESSCVLVILTAPVSFDSGEDLEPISAEALPACRVIYVRYRTLRTIHSESPPHGVGRRTRMPGPGPTTETIGEHFDQLAPTLKPLNPKVIDVETPSDMAKALAEIQKTLLKIGGVPQ